MGSLANDKTSLVAPPLPQEKSDAQAVKEIRKLVIDICRQNGGGHGGSAIGMTPMAVALWKYMMRYNPLNPEVSDISCLLFQGDRDACNIDISSGLIGIDSSSPMAMPPCCSTRCCTCLAILT